MLSKKAQYSIYALMHLAREYNNGPVLISNIAEKEKLPKKFLEAILLDLKNYGVVMSKKGKGGGYYLKKSPEEINLAEVIRLFDGAIALLPCATYKYYEACAFCRDENTCGVRSVIKDLRDETVNILKGTSLADILKREAKLSRKK
jgi:Rrf2 family protein